MRSALKAYFHWSHLLKQANKSQALAGEAGPAFRLITDFDFQIIKANPLFIETFNLKSTDLPNLLEVLCNVDHSALRRYFEQQLATTGRIEHSLETRDNQGQTMSLRCQAEYIQHPDPHLIWYLESLSAQLAPNELASLIEQVYQKTSAAMMIVNADLKIVSINPAFTQMTDFQLRDCLGKPITKFYYDLSNSDSYQNFLQQMSPFSGELLLNKNDGSHFPAQVLVNILQPRQYVRQYFLFLILDISKQKQLESELRFCAEVDPLTQLANRKLLFQSLENAIASAKRFKYTVGVLFLDMDGFKQINDHFGHGEGDKILMEVADRLQRCVRQVDTVARLGGDEFVVVLNGTSTDMVTTTAQRIIDFLTLNIKDQSIELHVSVSIGIAIYPQDSHSPMVLLQYADEAMYKAKSKGKRQFCWHN